MSKVNFRRKYIQPRPPEIMRKGGPIPQKVLMPDVCPMCNGEGADKYGDCTRCGGSGLDYAIESDYK